MSKNIVVVGDGWSALTLLAYLSKNTTDSLTWVTGTGARVDFPLSSLDRLGAALWKNLAHHFDVDSGELESGCFLREFRNKAFRAPAWTQAPTPEARQEVLNEMLWEAEKNLVPAFEGRLEISYSEIEARIREGLAGIRRIEGVPVNGFKPGTLMLSSGEDLPADEIFYADRWAVLPSLQGLPKPLSFIRRREPMGILQATFIHRDSFGSDLSQGFYGPIQKEAGEEFSRHVWGSFSADGKSSTWSVLLSQSEVEDNHQIAKKLRRMKQGIEKMISAAGWLPEGSSYFGDSAAGHAANTGSSIVQEEQVRFEESLFYASGEPVRAPIKTKLSGVTFLTDGYGASCAIQQAATALRDLIGVDVLTEAQALLEEKEWAMDHPSVPVEPSNPSSV